MRLASLALHKGRLTNDLVTALAIRGALLVDLTLCGRLTDTAEAFEFDPTPSGFAPADKLLARRAQSLSDMIWRRSVDQHDLAAEHVRRGSWTLERCLLGRRYVDHQAARTRRDKEAFKQDAGGELMPADAALIAVAGTLGLLVTRRALPTDALMAATEPLQSLVGVVVNEVNQQIVQGRAVRWADS
jgi:hypothetical protein